MYNEESSPNINNNLSMEWTVGFTQDQTNTNSINIRNSGITQNCKEQINALRQNSAEPVKENVHLVSSVSRHKKRNIFKKCKECKFRKSHYDEDFNQCKDCYRASIRILSDNDGPSYLNKVLVKVNIRVDDTLHQYLGITQHPETKKYDPTKRKQVFPNSGWNVREGYWGNELYKLIRRTEEGEIKFPENECTNILQPKINDQAVYSSRLLNSLINKALTLQSTDDDSRAIEFDINQPFIKF
ncbi:44431_t:CDS:2 [Gigaspora margarita]|uniref:44431_t:CDS:1 n=1 Tax=Gigaspora margarita TaxID=4874 RepID=A0ABN7UMJ2_GIGMA|nr:44431_t:CDS:2 [Gigaspora margarita]